MAASKGADLEMKLHAGCLKDSFAEDDSIRDS
jgi:hypothetical protein